MIGVGVGVTSLAVLGRRLPSLRPTRLFADGQQGLWLEVVQSGGFSPALLFAGGQQGLLFEPEG